MVNLLSVSKYALPDNLGKDIACFVLGCQSALMNSFSTFISLFSIESSSHSHRISGGHHRHHRNRR